MSIELCREDGVYEGGCELTANWRISRVTLDCLSAIEVSVLWFTEGKGDTDLNVHYFERLEKEQIHRHGLADQQSLSCVLPATPLSYHGRLIRLRWSVRLRLFMTNGREIVTNQPFYLVAVNSSQNGLTAIRSSDCP
ncbi:hypothetical protein [Roseiconus lacunae]|uniref:Uncharacterized protein n=1 Tax=Roseiconus lacunae TaxID=2605694 RepID=A0ABT7PJP1_9BACT|nr:hypothetical protein [Roseiconus lacunae]MCD0459487.1 hypothetical protein [Roseiconus lacunae]MDM4016727.1 hypothetical protein [Roseiconus lacunae]WRQ50959.1 hypothetical protein U8335_00125 [Stieleria sp. HD01]